MNTGGVEANAGDSSRGRRDSPRTPGDAEKLAKLQKLSQRLSPKGETPPLPGFTGAAGQEAVKSVTCEDKPATVADISRLLDSKLQPMQNTMESLERKFTELSVSTETKVDQLRTDVKVETTSILSRLQAVEKEIDNAKNKFADAPHVDGSNTNAVKIRTIEQQLQEMKDMREKDKRDDVHSKVAFVGGLGTDWSESEAKQWLQQKFEGAGALKPSDVYAKGDFRGFLYAKYETKAMRDTSVERLRRASLTRNGSRVWATEHKPYDQRVPQSFLFGLKRLMVEWGDSPKAVWVNTDAEPYELTCNREPVVSATVKDGKLEVTYEPDWEEYLNDPKLTTLRQTCDEQLKKALKYGGKGKGKNKSKDKHQ